MIYTLTTNPAIDVNVTADTLTTSKVNRTRDAVYTPNGKGLNVSFTLGHFGVPSTILGFFGGFSGRYIVEGAREVCPVLPVEVDGITRINMFVTTPEGEYKFPNAGAPVDEAAQQQMIDLIGGLDDLECLVVSGSLPPGIDDSFYDLLFDACEKRGAGLVLDISSPALARLVGRGPLLIKPNDEEVAAIFGVDVSSEADIVSALHLIYERGAQNILLTLGGDGAYFHDGEGIWRASAAPVEVYSSACAGDATLAAFLSVWLGDRGAVEQALLRAMATGGNVATQAGLGDFACVEELEGQIVLERLE